MIIGVGRVIITKLFLLLVLFLCSCGGGDGYEPSSLVPTPSPSPEPVYPTVLSITPTNINITAGQHVTLTVSGGVAPYKLEISDYKYGNLDRNVVDISGGSVVFKAANDIGDNVQVVVLVKDALERRATSIISIVPASLSDYSIDITPNNGKYETFIGDPGTVREQLFMIHVTNNKTKMGVPNLPLNVSYIFNPFVKLYNENVPGSGELSTYSVLRTNENGILVLKLKYYTLDMNYYVFNFTVNYGQIYSSGAFTVSSMSYPDVSIEFTPASVTHKTVNGDDGTWRLLTIGVIVKDKEGRTIKDGNVMIILPIGDFVKFDNINKDLTIDENNSNIAYLKITNGIGVLTVKYYTESKEYVYIEDEKEKIVYKTIVYTGGIIGIYQGKVGGMTINVN